MEIGEDSGERGKRCMVASCMGIEGVVDARMKWINFGYACGTALEELAATAGSCGSAGGCIESSHWEVS
jgi:hypothetical protein